MRCAHDGKRSLHGIMSPPSEFTGFLDGRAEEKITWETPQIFGGGRSHRGHLLETILGGLAVDVLSDNPLTGSRILSLSPMPLRIETITVEIDCKDIVCRSVIPQRLMDLGKEISTSVFPIRAKPEALTPDFGRISSSLQVGDVIPIQTESAAQFVIVKTLHSNLLSGIQYVVSKAGQEKAERGQERIRSGKGGRYRSGKGGRYR